MDDFRVLCSGLTNIKNQLKNKIVNNTETFVNDKANEFVNQFGSGRTEVKIGGLASDEIDYGIKTIQPLSKLDEKSKDLTFLQGQISSGENHGERRGIINLGKLVQVFILEHRM